MVVVHSEKVAEFPRVFFSCIVTSVVNWPEYQPNLFWYDVPIVQASDPAQMTDLEGIDGLTLE